MQRLAHFLCGFSFRMPYGCAKLNQEAAMIEPARDLYIYKVLTAAQWVQFQAQKSFTGSPVDVADGFIHLSCAGQLKETLDKWYAGEDEVAVLQVTASQVAENLKYEVSRGGAEFPHLFADLSLSAITKVWLVSSEAGAYRLPQDLTAN
jgi:uncharacterized protein (DUF952 family)